jgi:hypothetical protein
MPNTWMLPLHEASQGFAIQTVHSSCSIHGEKVSWQFDEGVYLHLEICNIVFIDAYLSVAASVHPSDDRQRYRHR